MRRIISILIVAGVVAVTTGAGGVVAFAPLSAAQRTTGGYEPKRSIRLAKSASTTGLPDALPPQDDTFSPLSTVRELLAAPEYPAGSQRYDGIGQETGGIWRTRVFGFLPSTVRCTYMKHVCGDASSNAPSITAQFDFMSFC